MAKYALNISADDNRILSACVIPPKGNYSGMPQVDELPTGETDKEKDITNWLYENGEYVYDPLPDSPEPEPAPEYVTYDELAVAIQEGVNSYGE